MLPCAKVYEEWKTPAGQAIHSPADERTGPAARQTVTLPAPTTESCRARDEVSPLKSSASRQG